MCTSFTHKQAGGDGSPSRDPPLVTVATDVYEDRREDQVDNRKGMSMSRGLLHVLHHLEKLYKSKRVGVLVLR